MLDFLNQKKAFLVPVIRLAFYIYGAFFFFTSFVMPGLVNNHHVVHVVWTSVTNGLDTMGILVKMLALIR